MGLIRFSPRFALLDLELRRLTHEPWLNGAVVMALPIAVMLMTRVIFTDWAAGLDMFRLIARGWLAVSLLALVPLMGLTFRGAHQHDDLEQMQLAGFTPFALLAGIAGSRLIIATMLVLVPFPFTLMCFLLGGLSASGLFSALVFLFATFWLVAAFCLLVGLLLPTGGLCWLLCLLGGGAICFAPGQTFDLAIELAGLPEGDIRLGDAGRTLLHTVGLLVMCRLQLGLRLVRGPLAVDGPERVAAARPRSRPKPHQSVSWHVREFAVGGTRGLLVRWLWYPLLLAVFAAAFRWQGFNWGTDHMLLAHGMAAGIGILLCAHSCAGLAREVLAADVRERRMDDLVLSSHSVLRMVEDKLRGLRRPLLEFWLAPAAWNLLLAALFPGTFAMLILPVVSAVTIPFVLPLMRVLALDLALALAWGGSSTGYVLVRRVGTLVVTAVVSAAYILMVLSTGDEMGPLSLFLVLPVSMWIWWGMFGAKAALAARTVAERVCLDADERLGVWELQARFPVGRGQVRRGRNRGRV